MWLKDRTKLVDALPTIDMLCAGNVRKRSVWGGTSALPTYICTYGVDIRNSGGTYNGRNTRIRLASYGEYSHLMKISY